MVRMFNIRSSNDIVKKFDIKYVIVQILVIRSKYVIVQKFDTRFRYG